MLFKNIFNALVLTAVVTAGPANLLARDDTALILCSEPNSEGACSDITGNLPTTCYDFPDVVTTRTISAALSGSGFECTLFQGADCTGTSVVLTQADGPIAVSNIVAVQCTST
ncbi:hypothetical protein C8J56DRAFT_1050246 [Mycena floridula]|nr:hypothetical protein C8J56DRAFT_1050246 [Mycena floridula]